MPITVKHVTEALMQLGGRASVEEIHRTTILLAPSPLPKASRQVVRGRLQDHSRQSAHYRQRGDYFRSVHGLADRRGIWELTQDGVLLAGQVAADLKGTVAASESGKRSHNPVWSRDELILALDLYVQTAGNPTSKDAVALEVLSTVLNKINRLNGVGGSDTLRNENGVYLKVMNFRRVDPMYLGQGKVGMTRGNSLEAVLWAEYDGKLTDLALDAEAIRQTVLRADEAVVAKLPSAEPYEGEEGGVVMRLHKRYERDPKLVAEKRKAAAATGDLACEVCGFNFKAAYGDLGEGYIEVHHTKPVHTLLVGTKTKLDDLALLCANCHRMAHRQRVPLTLKELSTVLRLPIP